MSTVIIDASKCENADCGECVDMCPMEICVLTTALLSKMNKFVDFKTRILK